MNRRSFFKAALGAVVAVVAPGLKLLPKVASRTAIARKRGPSAAELEFWRNRKLPGFNFYDLQANVQPLYKELGIERGVRFTEIPAGRIEWPVVSREYESGGYDPRTGWWKQTNNPELDFSGLLAYSFAATPKQLERAAQWSGADQARWRATRNA